MKRGSLKLTSKSFYFVSAIIILVLLGVLLSRFILGASPNPGHSADQIFIKYGSHYITFQHAITDRYIYTYKSKVDTELTSSDPFPPSTPYHLASQILVQMKSLSGVVYTMTLQEAIDHDFFLKNPDQSITTSLPEGGQYASDISINLNNVLVNLQTAITTGQLRCTPDCTYPNSCGKTDGCEGTCLGASLGNCPTGNICTLSGSCSPTAWVATTSFGTCSSCGQTLTRTVYCEDSSGNIVPDSYCSGTKPDTQFCNCVWKATTSKWCKLVISPPLLCSDSLGHQCGINDNYYLGATSWCTSWNVQPYHCGFLSAGSYGYDMECELQ
jgi:hypothetical protein